MSNKPSLDALTGIRFFAALYVVLFHYLDTQKYAGPLASSFMRYGYVGVSIFFVLSGFVLAYNYATFDTPAARHRFWLARFARIYPLYIAAFLFSLPVYFYYTDLGSLLAVGKAAVKIGLEAGLLSAWTPWTSCGVNCPGWSLSAEAFFYLLFPLLTPLLIRRSNRELKGLFVGLWGAALCVPIALLLLGPGLGLETGLYAKALAVTRFTPLFHLPQFLMGVVTGILFTRHSRAARTLPAWAGLSGIAALGLVVAAFVLLDLEYSLVNNGLFAPLFAWMLYLLARGGRLARLFSFKPLVLLGEASYAVYILQYPLAGWFSFLRGQTWMTTRMSPGLLLVYVLLLTALSIASFLWFEKPMRCWILKTGSRWFAPATQRAPSRVIEVPTAPLADRPGTDAQE